MLKWLHFGDTGLNRSKMNFTCFCFRLNVATGRSKVTHGARVLCLLDNAVLPNRSRGCQVLSMSLHLYKISVPRRLRRGCHWPMKSFSAVCPPLQFLPHQKTHNTWARAPAHWAWLTEVWPLSPSDPTGTLWALISVSCRANVPQRRKAAHR